jgi:hypothetical protein
MLELLGGLLGLFFVCRNIVRITPKRRFLNRRMLDNLWVMIIVVLRGEIKVRINLKEENFFLIEKEESGEQKR